MRRTEQLQELRLSGMMLHQDGPTHQWVPEQWWDLIVTIANHLAWAKVPTIWHGPKSLAISKQAERRKLVCCHRIL